VSAAPPSSMRGGGGGGPPPYTAGLWGANLLLRSTPRRAPSVAAHSYQIRLASRHRLANEPAVQDKC